MVQRTGGADEALITGVQHILIITPSQPSLLRYLPRSSRDTSSQEQNIILLHDFNGRNGIEERKRTSEAVSSLNTRHYCTVVGAVVCIYNAGSLQSKYEAGYPLPLAAASAGFSQVYGRTMPRKICRILNRI